MQPETFSLAEAPLPLDIQALTPRLVRIRLGERGADPATSYLPKRQWPNVEAPELCVELQRDPWRLALGHRGDTLWAQIALAETCLRPHVRLRLETAGDQHFYGLGAGAAGIDRLGVTRRLWNRHINHGLGADVPIPLLLSSRGYGLFFDCSSRGLIEPGDSSGVIEIAFETDETALDLYLLGGGSMRATLTAAAMLLGAPPMPPRWSLGYLQSTRHFTGTDELRQLAAAFREKRLPCDAIILLSTYGEALGWNRGVGHLECQPTLLPDPASVLGELRSKDFHIVTHEYPVVHPRSPLHGEAKERGLLLDGGYADLKPADPAILNYKEGQRYIDFSQPDARRWWWEAHRHLVDWGVEGWWLDGGEGPTAETRLAGGSGRDLHNRYDLLRFEAFAEGEARDRPERRPFLLCRSGGAGMQRHGAACWSGDIDSSFASLEAQVAQGLSASLSGAPYWGTDIGGFYSAGDFDAELFVRWFQFGAFCPIFRAHGRNWRKHLPSSHGLEIEAILRRYLELRYRLMPYTYTLAWQAHGEGIPLMRPLVLDHPGDPAVWALSSQYLWGDDLLVAPVTRSGAREWPVYLPSGRWIDFWTHEPYDGARGISVPAPLERLPLLVRAGSIVPMGPVVQHLGGGAPEELTLLVHPAGTSRFTLYEDDGITTGYRSGRYALTDFSCSSEAGPGSLILGIGAPHGDAACVPSTRRYVFQILAAEPPCSITQEGIGTLQRTAGGADAGWWHDGQFLFIRVSGHPAAVTARW
jgi:alpha-glucosidase